jgi:hypothetical protein
VVEDRPGALLPSPLNISYPMGRGVQPKKTVDKKTLSEKFRSKRINLEGNTHAQEINVSQLPV